MTGALATAVRAGWVLLLVALSAADGEAHEMRPGYLHLREGPAGEFAVLWKVPMLGDARLSLTAVVGDGDAVASPVRNSQVPGASIQEWRVRVGELRGQTVRIAGLEATMTDVLVRAEFEDGTDWTARLTPAAPEAIVPQAATPLEVAGTYTVLGIEHILFGFDHLCFVLGLILLTRGGVRLLAAVTSFTVAHGFTLTAAALGFVHVPQPPVEAVIALSIVFVAREILTRREGEETLAVRSPWLVAFAFGLLHGLGFAGALSEVGLPQTHIPVALLCFSVGVEAGHMLFVGAVIAGVRVVGGWTARVWARFESAAAYSIGSVASFWLLQRLLQF